LRFDEIDAVLTLVQRTFRLIELELHGLIYTKMV